MYQKQIADLLEQVVTGPLGQESPGDLERFVEVPKDKSRGDLAFPCFRFAKLLKANPAKIAADMTPHLEAALPNFPGIKAINVSGPYLNFIINKAALAGKIIPDILEGDFLAQRPSKNEKVMVEYSQPNTHKAFHVGHTRNVALGDALVRIMEWSGYEMVPVNYIGDEGAHIAKCLWYYRNHFKGEVPKTNRGEFLGDLYTNATVLLDFKTLTRVPMPHITTARVLAISELEAETKNKLVDVDTGKETLQVLCGGIDYKVGDIVAYAGIGARVGTRTIGVMEKFGVTSTGMICSESELGLSDRTMEIHTFPADTALGVEVAEYFRIDGALPADRPVLDEMKARTQGVADTLHLLEDQDPEISDLWKETKQWSMDEFHEIYNWLDARFDHYFYESDVGNSGKKICQEFHEKGVLVQSEGAIGADLSDHKLPFLLLIKSNGAGLYATKDIALAQVKFDQFGVDRSIYVVDASQSLHFQQVFKTLEMMGYEKAAKCYHLAYGLVMLPGTEGRRVDKMSSRDGNVILFSELKATLDQRIKNNFLNRYRGDWSDEEIEEAAKRISVATIKCGMVNQDNVKDIIFDLEDWTSQTGNNGAYLMYAYARTRSILRKAENDWRSEDADWDLLTHPKEEALLNEMARFPDIMERTLSEYRPQWLCIYLYDLARLLNKFYDECTVLGADSDALKATRLLLVDAAGRLIGKGLDLLGVKTLDRM